LVKAILAEKHERPPKAAGKATRGRPDIALNDAPAHDVGGAALRLFLVRRINRQAPDPLQHNVPSFRHLRLVKFIGQVKRRLQVFKPYRLKTAHAPPAKAAELQGFMADYGPAVFVPAYHDGQGAPVF
jgi:hypothetical protein